MKILKKVEYQDLIIIIFFSSLIYSLYIFTNNFFRIDGSLRHWTNNHDEIHQIYNALLYNNGFTQEYLDHPGAVSILILSIGIKIANFFSYLDFSSINQFNNSKNIETDLNKLFFVSRIIYSFLSLFFCLFVYYFIKIISRSNFTSFFLTIIFIFSTGFISGSNLVASELPAAFILFLSLYFLLKFILENKNEDIYLYLFFFLAFVSVIQKVQTFFIIIPTIICVFYFLKKKKDLRIRNLNINYSKKFFYIILLIVLALIVVKSAIAYGDFGSAFFLIFNYLILNVIMFFYIRFYQNKLYQNLISYNILLILAYISVKLIFTYHPSANLEVFNIAYSKIFSHAKSFVSDKNSVIFKNYSFGELILYIFISFAQILKKNFLQINFQSLLIYFSLISLVLFGFRDNKKIISVSFLILIFLYVQFFLSFRAEYPQYMIFSEFFLIISFALIFRDFKLSKFKKFVLIVFTIILIFQNYPYLLKTKIINNINNCDTLFSSKEVIEERFHNHYQVWTKKIPFNVVKQFCG